MFDFQTFVARKKPSGTPFVRVKDYAFREDIQRLRQLSEIPLLPTILQKSLQAWNLTERLHLRHISKSVSIDRRTAACWQTVCADMGTQQHEARIIPGQKQFVVPYGDGRTLFFGLSPECCALPTAPLRFAFGCGIGAAENGHVPYITLARLADRLTHGLYDRAKTIADALLRWQQAASITQDRAGLIASRDMSAAMFIIMRSTCDWSDEEIMTEIRRFHAGQDVDFGSREAEMRIQALTLFKNSAFYAGLCNLPADQLPSMTELDNTVAKDIRW